MFRATTLLAGLLAAAPAAAQTATITFEDLTPTRPNPTGTGSFENGRNLPGPPRTFTSGGATFNNNYNATFDSWSRWAYSTVNDTATAGFANQYAAYVQPTPVGGAGASGSATYAVAFGNSAAVVLPDNYRPDAIKLTNTTYAALSMLNGDPFAKKFGGATGNDADFFKVTIRGLAADGVTATGSKEVFLADYRFADNTQDYVVKDWTAVDLSADLSSATRRLAFTFASSDVGQFGINTPTYFAVDDLVISFIAPVPEPGAVLLAAGAAALGWRRWRRA